MTTRKHVQQNEASPESGGRNPQGYGRGASTASTATTENIHQTENLMEAAGERVLERITGFLERKLRLKVNREKSAVDRPWKRKFLGYTMTWEKSARLKPSPANVKRLKDSIRDLMRRGKGRSLERVIAELTPKLRGWGNYFKLSEVKLVFEDLDSWIRRKLRNMIWRQWKKGSIPIPWHWEHRSYWLPFQLVRDFCLDKKKG